jgi:hypothetical protein
VQGLKDKIVTFKTPSFGEPTPTPAPKLAFQKVGAGATVIKNTTQLPNDDRRVQGLKDKIVTFETPSFDEPAPTPTSKSAFHKVGATVIKNTKNITQHPNDDFRVQGLKDKIVTFETPSFDEPTSKSAFQKVGAAVIKNTTQHPNDDQFHDIKENFRARTTRSTSTEGASIHNLCKSKCIKTASESNMKQEIHPVLCKDHMNGASDLEQESSKKCSSVCKVKSFATVHTPRK